MNISKLYSLFKLSQGVNTDTRTLQKDEMFIALKGENFDGNNYAIKALEAGAKFAIVSNDSEVVKSWTSESPYPLIDTEIDIESIDSDQSYLVQVEDTYIALRDLAKWHRENVLGEGKRLPVIGLTGTNGKTTTKELINRVLSTKYQVCATQGNLNNDIGVPLSLLKIKEDTDIAIIEMGANHPDDIYKLVRISEPDFGLITNVGKAHLLGFGSIEGVSKAKGQLYDYLIENGGTIFYNIDDERLTSMLEERKADKTVPYGLKYWKSEILPVDSSSPFLKMLIPVNILSNNQESEEEVLVETQLVGSYNANNVIAALAIAKYFKVSMAEAIMAIYSFAPSNNRSQMVKTENNTLIVDAYNANPTSMAAALDNFELMEDENKFILLGNMGELGDDSLKEHCNLVNRLKQVKANKIFLVGAEFSKALDEVGKQDNISWFENSEALAKYLSDFQPKNSLILIKGSRSTAMEKVVGIL